VFARSWPRALLSRSRLRQLRTVTGILRAVPELADDAVVSVNSPHTVAVIAHRKKSLGGGLSELSRTLAAHGIPDPAWYEVSKSKEATTLAEKAVSDGATLLFIWGGDGTVQRCLDAVAGRDIAVAVVPAGTANLLATNLGIPDDIGVAVRIGIYGDRRPLDIGVLNGKRFAVMAGVGFDAHMMLIADGGLKERWGQLAYVWAAIRATRIASQRTTISVDGSDWFAGKAAGVLLGQLGTLTSGLVAFPEAEPDDGQLEVAVITADTWTHWLRVLYRLVSGHPERSSLARTTRGSTVDIALDQATPYELDGSPRKAKKMLRASIEPAAITVCVSNRTVANWRPLTTGRTDVG
jgi:diacylglycerol kinase (ATP)